MILLVRRCASVHAVVRIAAAGAFAMLTVRLPAQRAGGESLGDRVVHETWSRGIPGNGVRGIIQTRDGYLRLATDGGLASFDGVRFRVKDFATNSASEGFPDNYIRGLVETRSGDLWLATEHSGAVEFHAGRFRAFTVAQGLPDNVTNVVYEDRNGGIWAGTRDGAAKRKGDGFEPVSGVPASNVYTITEDDSGAVWIGTETGLLRVRNGTVDQPLVPFGSVRVLRILRAHDGSLWVGTERGLAHLVRATGGAFRVERVFTVRDGLRSAYVNSIAQQRDGVIWVGTLGGGIARLEADEHFRSMGTNEGLADNNTLDVFVDGEDNLWAATSDGLTRVRKPTIRNFDAPGPWSTSLLWSANVLPDGTAWIGSGSDGAIRINRDGTARHFTTADGLPSDVVFTSHRRRDGSVWVGTKAGVARLVGDRFTDQTAAMGLQQPTEVRTITEDSRNRLWIGSASSVSVEGPNGRVVMKHRDGMVHGRIYTIAEDSTHRIWVAGSALFVIDGDSMVPFAPAVRDSITHPMTVHTDGDGVWVGDYRKGLIFIRGDSLRFFPTERTGLFSNVLQIIDDGHGSLWFTSGSGLQRVRKADLIAYLEKPDHRIPNRVFTKSDGMRSDDFGKAGNSSGTRAPDGRLWLPTTAGLVVLDPAAIPVDSTEPKAYVERVVADGVAIAADSVVTIPRGAHRVSIEFTATVLATPSSLRLWYQLEGVDSTWKELKSDDRVATYEDLPRGRLTFRVKAETADGVVTRVPVQVVLISTPPLTRSAWFWVLIVAVATTTAATFYRFRVGRLHEHSAMLQRLVDDRTEALATRERLEHELLHAQKMESVGRLAGGIAHDLNNMLTAVVGHAELMAFDTTLTDATRADVAEIHLAAKRATDLTAQLLTFARKQKGRPRLLSIGELILRVEKLVARLLPEEITCATEALEGEWSVRVDPGQLEQVVVNLAVNARDAMPAGGTLHIRSRAVTVDAAFSAKHPDLVPGDYVVLEVKDSGVGMAPDTLARLFEPFFTTKALGKGTGLGLAVSYGIITQYGGHILVDSLEGHGTTFSAYLPRDASTTGETPAADAEPQKQTRGSERILLVEDEETVRAVAERLLRTLGYTVVTAVDGQDALRVVEAARGDFALVLTDVRMPRLGGPELAAHLHTHWPAVRVAFMSGYTEPAPTGVGLPHDHAVLSKPFSITELAGFVRDTLDRGVR